MERLPMVRVLRVLLACWSLRWAAALDSIADGTVKHLSQEDFQSVMGGEGTVWLVGYTDPACAECEKLVPIMEEVAKDLEPLGIPVGVFDLVSTKAKKLAMATGIQTLPALHLFLGEAKKNPYTGKMHRQPLSFQLQQREVRARQIKKFVTDSLPNLVTAVTEESFTEYVKEEGLQANTSLVLAFSNRESTSPLLKALALRFKGRLSFAEVPMSDSVLTSAFAVEEAPAVVVVPVREGQPTDPEALAESATKFQGNAKDLGEVSAFLDEFAKAVVPATPRPAAAHAKAQKQQDEEDDDDKPKKKKAPHPDDKLAPMSHPLNETTFSARVLKDEQQAAWVVYFMAKPEDEDGEEWQAVVNKCEGLVHAAHVDCQASATLCLKYLTGRERFVSFPYGPDKEEELKAFPTAAAALDDAGSTLPADAVKRGDSSPVALDNEIGMAMGSSKYPIIVLSRKEEPAPFLRSLAVQLGDVASFIFIANPSPALLSRFQDPHVPNIVLLLPQAGQLSQTAMPPSGTPYNFRLAIYNPAIFGRMGFRSVLSFLLNVWQQADPTYANKVVTEVVRGVKPDAEAAAAVGGGGKLSAITHGEWGTSQCSPTSAGLCVIGFLAGEPEQGSQKRHLDVLRQVAAAEASAPLRFLYVDGICFAGFAEAFDLQPPKLPTLAVYSAKKQRFASYIGSFEVEDVRGFLRGVLSGRIPTAPVLHTPVVDEQCAVAPASSGEESLVVEEEEEDIGDLMAEILADEKRRKEELAAQLKQEQEMKKREAEEAAKLAAEEAAKKAAAAKKKKKKAAAKKKKAKDDEL